MVVAENNSFGNKLANLCIARRKIGKIYGFQGKEFGGIPRNPEARGRALVLRMGEKVAKR